MQEFVKKLIYLIPIILTLKLIAAGSNDSPVAELKPFAKDIKTFHTLADIIKTMEQSEIIYTYDMAMAVEGSIVDETVRTSRMLLDYYKLDIPQDGSIALIIDSSTQEVAEKWPEVKKFVEVGELDKAIECYQEAIALEPDYFKTYTFLGNIYYMQGDYRNAKQNFLKAISLNVIDYQAYHFLGDTYSVLGNTVRAKYYLTYAFMLNKNNPFLRMSLRALLEKENKTIRENRLSIPAKIEVVNDKTARLVFQKEGGGNWIALVTCLACWKMEPSFKKLLTEDDPLNLTMYKEGLVNQMVFTEENIKANRDISATEQSLHDAIKDGYLNAILFWEIGASIIPEVILLLPQEEKEKIIEYIEKYVFIEK